MWSKSSTEPEDKPPHKELSMKSGLVDNTPQPSNGQKQPRHHHHDAENGAIDDSSNGSGSGRALAATNGSGGRDDDRPSAYVVNNRDVLAYDGGSHVTRVG